MLLGVENDVIAGELISFSGTVDERLISALFVLPLSNREIFGRRLSPCRLSYVGVRTPF